MVYAGVYKRDILSGTISGVRWYPSKPDYNDDTKLKVEDGRQLLKDTYYEVIQKSSASQSRR